MPSRGRSCEQVMEAGDPCPEKPLVFLEEGVCNIHASGKQYGLNRVRQSYGQLMVLEAVRSGFNPLVLLRSTGAEEFGLQPGDHVVHSSLGAGVVSRVYGESPLVSVVLVLERGGPKRFLLRRDPALSCAS